MSHKRITISVPAEIATKAAHTVAAGTVDSVSAYFSQLAAREPDWAAAQMVVAEMIEEAGGFSVEDLRWANEVLGLVDMTAA